MAIFPVSEPTTITPDSDIINDRGVEMLFDFSTNEFVMKDGDIILLDGDASTVFWIEKTLRTEYERARVYKNTQYGVEIEGLIGFAVPNTLAKVALENNIKNAILKHERVKYVSKFKMKQEESKIYIEFEIEIAEMTRKPYVGAMTSIDALKKYVTVQLMDKNRLLFKTNLGAQVNVGVYNG